MSLSRSSLRLVLLAKIRLSHQALKTLLITVVEYLQLLDPRPTEGPIKSPFCVCLSVWPSVQHFSQKWFNSFF